MSVVATLFASFLRELEQSPKGLRPKQVVNQREKCDE